MHHLAPGQPIGDDTQASFTVSRDGQSLEVCSTPPNDGWRQCYRASKRPTAVASLGDSYSAGEGAGGYDPASRGCHRSPYAWTKYLEARNPTRWRVESFLACSGAEMPNLTGTFKGEGPQVSRIHPFTEVVTVTIGGNDTGFSDVLTSCFLRWKLHQKNCVQKGKPYGQAKKLVRGPLASRLAASYQAIRAQAPKDARLVVVGYPRLFPLRGKAVRKCGWLVPQVRKALNGLAVELDNVIRATATRNGATFVDVLDTLSGHEACTGGASWVYPIKPATNAQAGHPMARGQYALARRIGSALGPDAAVRRRGLDQRREQRRLGGIGGRRVLGVPLDADVPGAGVVELDRLDHAVGRERDRAQPGAEPADALVVVAGDRRSGADHARQQRVRRHLDRLDDVAVRAFPQVLDQVSPARDVDHLVATAHGEQREARGERVAGHREIEGVLLLVDVVLRRVRALPGPVRGQVAAAGQEHAVGVPEALGDLVGVDPGTGRDRVDDEGLAAGGVHGVEEGARRHVRAVPQGRGGRREAGRDGDERAGHRGSFRRSEQIVLILTTSSDHGQRPPTGE